MSPPRLHRADRTPPCFVTAAAVVTHSLKHKTRAQAPRGTPAEQRTTKHAIEDYVPPPWARCPVSCPSPLFGRSSASTRPGSPENRHTCRTRTRFRMTYIVSGPRPTLGQSQVAALRQRPLGGCGFPRSTDGAKGSSTRGTPCTQTPHLPVSCRFFAGPGGSSIRDGEEGETHRGAGA